MMIMDRIGRKGGCVEDGGDFEENGTFVIVIWKPVCLNIEKKNNKQFDRENKLQNIIHFLPILRYMLTLHIVFHFDILKINAML